MAAERIALLLLACGLVAPGHAEAQECTPVTTIPARLEAGNHCLVFDFGVGGTTAITLGEGARLDCRGHRVRALFDGYFSAVSGVGDDIIVRNCVVTGFHTAISIRGDRGLVTGNVVRDATVGISVTGSNALVERNAIRNYKSSLSSADGISVNGSVDVIENSVMGNNTPSSGRYGIRISGGKKGVIARNAILDVGGPASMQSIAILTIYGGAAIIRDNIATAAPGSGDLPIFCYSDEGSVSVGNIWTGFPRTSGSCE